jgi:phytoene synthase
MHQNAAICYAFCRLVDDAVDEAPGARAARYEIERIEAMLRGETPRLPIVDAYVQLAERAGFGLGPAWDLLEGVRSDLAEVRIGTDAEFLQYCYRVAGTVGLMMCGVLGVKERAARRNAVALGIAMQMTNICRDVLEDAERGRVYLPLARLSGVHLSHSDVLCSAERNGTAGVPAVARSGVSEVVRSILDWGDSFYEAGANGYGFIPPRPRLAIMVASSLYSEIGAVLRSRGCDPFAGRARVSLFKKVVLTMRSAMTWFNGALRRPSARAERPAYLLTK